MKPLWLTLLLLIPAALFSQDTLNTKEVPEEVIMSFERRNRGVENTVWVKEDDMFVVSYENRYGKPEAKYYTEEGELEKTVQTLDVRDIRRNMIEYIDENHRMYDPYAMYYIEKGRRDRYYSIMMHHRKAENPPDTEIQFDQSGRFISIMNLYIPDDKKEDPEIDPDFAEQVDSEAYNLSETVDEKEVKKKDLPSNVLDYIETMYPYPFRMQSANLMNSEDGPVYIIIMKEQGDDFHYKLTFSHDGEIMDDEKIYEN